MSRTFFYARVSTQEQDTANQVLEAQAAGYDIQPHRILEETISGATVAVSRPKFQKLLERMEEGDTLVVSKLDRIGRNAIDIQTTLATLGQLGIKVICMNLGTTDLTSTAGKMLVAVLAAVAQMERDLLIERTHAGLEKAKAAGKVLGRPKGSKSFEKVQALKATGLSQSKVVAASGLSLATVKRLWKQPTVPA